MDSIATTIKMAFATVGAFIGGLVGGMDGLLYALIAMMALDYAMGVIIAITHKRLSSDIGFKGITKKIMMLVLVAVGHIIDARVIGTGAVLRTAVITFYMANEAISLTENAANIGLPLPQKLIDILAQLRNGEDKDYKEADNNEDN